MRRSAVPCVAYIDPESRAPNALARRLRAEADRAKSEAADARTHHAAEHERMALHNRSLSLNYALQSDAVVKALGRDICEVETQRASESRAREETMRRFVSVSRAESRLHGARIEALLNELAGCRDQLEVAMRTGCESAARHAVPCSSSMAQQRASIDRPSHDSLRL